MSNCNCSNSFSNSYIPQHHDVEGIMNVEEMPLFPYKEAESFLALNKCESLIKVKTPPKHRLFTACRIDRGSVQLNCIGDPNESFVGYSIQTVFDDGSIQITPLDSYQCDDDGNMAIRVDVYNPNDATVSQEIVFKNNFIYTIVTPIDEAKLNYNPIISPFIYDVFPETTEIQVQGKIIVSESRAIYNLNLVPAGGELDLGLNIYSASGVDYILYTKATLYDTGGLKTTLGYCHNRSSSIYYDNNTNDFYLNLTNNSSTDWVVSPIFVNVVYQKS